MAQYPGIGKYDIFGSPPGPFMNDDDDDDDDDHDHHDDDGDDDDDDDDEDEAGPSSWGRRVTM